MNRQERQMDDLTPHEQAKIAANMYVAMTNDTRPVPPPPLSPEARWAITKPRTSWLRVEIHFGALLLFYGVIYGPLTVYMLLNPPPRLSVSDYVVGGLVLLVGFNWLQLMFLGWITRKLGSVV
jgi:hypothetical protein